jgi:glycosyltransferase involved in cell wall biosynthesis
MGTVTGDSLQQSYVNDPALRAAIRVAIDEFKPDIGFFNVIRTAQFLDEFDKIPCFIDLDEFRSNFYALMEKSGRNILWRWIAKLEGSRLRSAEQRALASFRTLLVSSPTDLLPGNDKVRLVRSPHAIQLDPQPLRDTRKPRSIIFVGRQSYRANAEAIAWLVREVLPLVLLRVPDAHVTIVGDAPPKTTYNLCSPNVTVTGRVDELSEYYASAALSVVPVRMATGVQMKLIESMLSGTAVVATPIVAYGAGISSEHCMIADTVQEWADAIVEILLNEEKAARLAKAAQKWAFTNYSTEAIGNALDEAVGHLCQNNAESQR